MTESALLKPSTDPVSFMAFVGSASAAKEQGFEGPEKRLEIIVTGGPEKGLRCVPTARWESIIAILNAQIVSKVDNCELDAYVLTESSLFVFRMKVILITCGTTVLLHSLAPILALIEELDMKVEWASFMRKNFSYPWSQIGPHESMRTEYSLLKAHLPLGRPFIFGPVDSDHYFMFVYDDIKRPAVEDDAQLSLTMYDLDEKVANAFFSSEFVTGPENTRPYRDQSNISTLVEGWTIQDLQFAPCGYSVNAIFGDEYQTMHITPESHCSFASYETNSKNADISSIITRVVDVFRPKRFSMVLLIDPHSPLGIHLSTEKSIQLNNICGFVQSNMSVNEFAPGYSFILANYTRQ